MLWFKKSFPTTLYAQTRLQQSPQIAVKASDYNILERPANFHKRLLELIGQAQDRIMMTLLYLQDDEAGNEILQALYDARQRNPKLYIRVYVDFHRAQRGLIGKEPQDTNAQMYQRYAQEHESNPLPIYGVPVKRRELFGVLHIKGIVIDNTVLYSGCSLNNVYLHHGDRYRLDRYHEINSKELADTLCNYTNNVFHMNFAVQDFSQGQVKTAKELKPEIKMLQRALTRSQYSFRNHKLQDDEVGITPIVGLGKRNNLLNRAILWAIDSAKHDLFICTPYFNPPKVLQEHIECALERGVNITLVVGDKEANDFYIKKDEPFSPIGAVPYVYEQNLRSFVNKFQARINAGQLKVQLWKNGDNTYHLKGIFVDRHLAIITGNNLNPRAWNLDLENGLFVHDPHHLLQEKFMHEKQYILKHTTQVMSTTSIEPFESYPEQVQKLLNKVQRFCASFILKKLL